MTIGVGAQPTLEARHFCLKNMYEKLTKCPNFTWFSPKNCQNTRIFMIFTRKINKFPNFTWHLPEKCPNIRPYMTTAQKMFFLTFWGGGVPHLLRLCLWPMQLVDTWSVVLVCILIAYLIGRYKQLRINQSQCQLHIDQFNKPHTPGFFQGMFSIHLIHYCIDDMDENHDADYDDNDDNDNQWWEIVMSNI